MPNLSDLLTPAWDLLLVRRDPSNRQIGIGLGGRALVMPDTATDLQPCRSGVILKAGPDALYRPGQRVAFGNYAMTTLAIEGDSGDAPGDETAVGLLPSTEVLCTWSASEAELPRPLDLDGADLAQAPNGCLLVERSEIPKGRGRILMPGTYTESIRSLEATVKSIHPSAALAAPFDLGELVLLGSSVGRHVGFGLRADRVLWVAMPQQILGRLAAVPEEGVEALDDETPLKFRGRPRPPADVKWDEGDARAPR
jgi:hypothetical protein